MTDGSMSNEIGRYIIYFGVLIVLAGIVIYFFGDKLKWFGNLPGDISIKKENFSFYFPLTTTIIIGAAIILMLYLARKFF